MFSSNVYFGIAIGIGFGAIRAGLRALRRRRHPAASAHVAHGGRGLVRERASY